MQKLERSGQLLSWPEHEADEWIAARAARRDAVQMTCGDVFGEQPVTAAPLGDAGAHGGTAFRGTPADHERVLRAASEDDRAWFAKCSRRSYRIRPAYLGEFPPNTGDLLAVVRQVRPGLRCALGLRARITPPNRDRTLAPVWAWLAAEAARSDGAWPVIGGTP